MSKVSARAMLLAGITILGAAAGPAIADDAQLKLLADQLRLQGFACAHPKNATRNAAASRPNESVWNVDCDEASYRMQLVPDMAAKIEKLSK